MSKEIQPIFILPEGTQRTFGKSAQRNNIMAAKLVAETVRTTLGPKGMDKLIVDSMGDITVTNDGITILEEMHVEHPVAKMIVEVAKTQENEIGDGTTTAVIIAGELLKKAEILLEQNVHPTVIVKGFWIAEQKAQEILRSISEKINVSDDVLLKQVAGTALTGKGAEIAKDLFSELAVKSVKKVLETKNGKIICDRENIKIEKHVGASVDESELIEGVVIEKEAVHPGMPKIIKNAKIALLDTALEIKDTEIDAKIEINDPSQIQSFLDQEQKMIKDMVDKVVKSGANVVFCQKGIDDVAQHFLAKKNIFAARRLKKSDLDSLAKATGAKIVTSLDDLNNSDLGFAGCIEERKVGDEEMTFITECKNPKSVTILIRGGSTHVIDEFKRAMTDAIGDVAVALKNERVVAGGGAVEMELAKELRKFADSLSSREQLAVSAFADALEIIPKTLAENAGIDPIDVIAELKFAHDKGKKWAGIDVFSGKVVDSWQNGVIEPLSIKTQAISSASESAQMILRIDDVIAGSKSNSGPQMPPDMSGMGGMGY